MEYMPTKNLETFMKSRQDFTTEKDYQDYLRTYFAAMALQGLLTRVPNRPNNETDLGVIELKRISEESTIMADALINALNEKP